MTERSEVTALYTDGGVIGKNPSKIGGTFAWCYVNALGERVASGYGDIAAAEQIGLPTVSNNVTELMAVVMGMEALPTGWAGTIYTDSFVTLCRVEKGRRKPAKLNGVPDWLQERLAIAKGRLGDYKVVLLGGHPTKAELAAGVSGNGFPVSEHNVWCDKQCNKVADEVRAKIGRAAA